ncbi:MAG TPA: hypothetical protein VFB27_07540, partial [Opitutaceae bacterium]|nr:hypothetical protein [Opitutaceae bacterium]
PAMTAPKNKFLRFAASCLGMAWLAGLLALGVCLRADDFNLEPFQQDARMLSSKIAEFQYRLKSSKDGEQRLSDLESQLNQLKACLDRLTELAGDLSTEESHLHYLKNMELDPKEREVERVRQNAEQRLQDITQQLEAWNAEADRHNAQKPNPEDEGAVSAYNAEANEGNARHEHMVADYDRIREEVQQEIEQAVQALAKVQQEYTDAETKRDQTVSQLQDQAQQYTTARGPLVDQLVALESEPVPTSVPLTPFSRGVAPQEADTVPVERLPVGPGNDKHAIDQLQVVTSSSRAAAGRDENDKPAAAGTPADVTAKVRSGYEFDSGGGLAPAALPNVDVPAGEPVSQAIPLVVAPAPNERADAPPEVKESPKLQAVAQQQADNFKDLDQLYTKRRELAQQGANASPQEWTKVVNDISTKQAAITTAAVQQKLAEGSKTIDLTIIPKAQRKKISDLNVPPPPPPSSPP